MNNGNKKTRHVKNIGSVYFDNTKKQWIGQVENGKYANGRVKFKRFIGTSQEDVVHRMKLFKQNNQIATAISPTELIMFDDYMESYMTVIKQMKLKPASYVRDYGTFKNQIRPYLGGYEIHEITPNIIQKELIGSLIKNNLSYSTIHKAYVLTNECLSYAYKQQVIPNNPCALVEKPTKKGLTNQYKEIRFFNDDEIERFKTVALQRNKNGDLIYTNGYAFIILIYTGLRAGEMLALTWENVDLNNNYIKVSSNVGAKYNEDMKIETFIQDSTKTKKSRVVHLTKSAKRYLTELKESQRPNKKDYVIISNTDVRSFSILRNSYLGICKRAQINNPQGLHTLRHTFASLMIRKGVDIKIISEMLGHASVSFTYNTYVHLIEEEKAKVIQQIDV